MERKLMEEEERKLALEQQASQFADENRKLQVQAQLAEQLRKQQLEDAQANQQQFNYSRPTSTVSNSG